MVFTVVINSRSYPFDTLHGGYTSGAVEFLTRPSSVRRPGKFVKAMLGNMQRTAFKRHSKVRSRQDVVIMLIPPSNNND